MGYTTPVQRRLVATFVSVGVLALLGGAIALWRAERAPAQSPPSPLQQVFDLLGPNDEPQSEPGQQPEPVPQPTPQPQPSPPLPAPGQPGEPQPQPSVEPTPAPEQPQPSPEPTPQAEQPQPQQAPPPQSEQAQPTPSNGATFRTAPMQPFPTVRIKGYLVRGGARITLLSVTAPPRSRVTVTCRGRGCPVRRRSAVMSRGTMRVRAFERTLRSGVRLALSVTSPDRLGKYTYIRIRRDRVPLRRDACLKPGGSRPVSCSA